MKHWFVLSLALFSILISEIHAYSVIVAPLAEECFIVQATAKGISCSGSYEVITPLPKPIRVTVKNINDYVHYDSDQVKKTDEDPTEGSFEFETELEGDHSICISNGDEKNNDGQTRVVAFNLRCLASDQQDYQSTGLESELLQLRQGLDFLKDHQAFMNQRENMHKKALEDIDLKVLCWTFFEATILIAMSLWQIIYIRGFFEVKRRL